MSDLAYAAPVAYLPMQNNAFHNALGLQKTNTKQVDSIKHDNTLTLSHYDIQFFNDVMSDVPAISKNIKDGLDMVKTFRNLSEDIYLDLFKYKPHIRDKSEINKSRHFNYDLMQQIREHPGYEGLQKICKLDEFNSALGASTLQSVAIDKVREYIETHRRKQEQQGNLGGGESMIDLINQLSNSETRDDFDGKLQPQDQDEDNNGNQPGLIDKIDQDGQNDQNNGGNPGLLTDDAAKQLADMQSQRQYDNMLANIADEIGQAATDMYQELEELSELAHAWGFDGEGTKSRINFDSKRMAVERIRKSQKLKDLTKILGRFKAIARNKLKERSIGTGSTIRSVTIGNQIDKILPSELTTFANEKTKLSFYKKLHERQLFQYETINDKRRGMGPIIVCEDASGSMHGNRTMWARAVTLSLLEIAQRQNRDFTIIFFDNKIVAKFTVMKNELDPKTLVDIAEVGADGGTDFEKPTNMAMDIIEKAKRFRKADIVFITDGDCALSSQGEAKLISLKKRLKVKIQTILIGCGNSYKSTVKAWSDSIQTIQDLSDMNSSVAENIFVNTISDINVDNKGEDADANV